MVAADACVGRRFGVKMGSATRIGRHVEGRRRRTEPSSDSRSIAIAYQWAFRVMTVALEMALPGLAGAWLDKRLGTRIVFVLIGLGLGCTLGILHLIRMTSAGDRDNSKSSEEQDNKR